MKLTPEPQGTVVGLSGADYDFSRIVVSVVPAQHIGDPPNLMFAGQT